MSCSLKSGLYISGPNETLIPSSKSKGVVGFLAPFSHSQFRLSKTRSFPGLSVDFNGRPLVVSDQKRLRDCNTRAPKKFSAHVCKFFASFSFLPLKKTLTFIECYV